MFESGKTNPVLKKAYEIAYALCRIAANVSEKYFADTLASEGVKLLGFAAEGDLDKAQRSLTAAKYFINLGMGVGSVDSGNGELLIGECVAFERMVANMRNAKKHEPVDLSGIFTPAEESAFSIVPAQAEVRASNRNSRFKVGSMDHPSPRIMTEENEDDKKNESGDIPEMNKSEYDDENNSIYNPAKSGNNPATANKESDNGYDHDIVETVKSGNRQGVILEKIRKSGNCRIKEIQELFPELSERTLRYDLRLLAEQNLIEKVGIGGPAVFYRGRG